ncbi:MAG: PqqD family peptide modification chaperone [Actinobacteria bacterium]|uniref:Unannotated protein n=1 Tax=freshwater metagenome TaxID=449393 RepID=A0A6J5YKS3_9ZZZZ|nr:PqqD family peptide modification chaperone [Actinomycetota bacterium]
MVNAETFWTVQPEWVMSEILDGEAVIVDLRTGRYHGAQGVAATAWSVLGRTADLSTIVREVSEVHAPVPTDVEARISAFVDQLLAAELIVEVAGSAASATIVLATVGASSPWNDPVLESHNDLEDLLLLDPVHDVGADGWPQVAPPK